MTIFIVWAFLLVDFKEIELLSVLSKGSEVGRDSGIPLSKVMEVAFNPISQLVVREIFTDF